jgi:hypothetical protein
MKNKEIKIGCKFCHYNFSIFQMIEYINHLNRFHIDETQKKLKEFHEELRKVKEIPK